MPQLTAQPTTTHVAVGNLDAVKYGITPGPAENIIVVGSEPTLTVHFNNTPQGGPGNIIVFGQAFTVTPDPSDAENINLFDADAETQANNFALAINANALLFPYITIDTFEAVGAEWRVVVSYNERKTISPTLDVSGLSTALPTATSNTGTPTESDGGYRVAYQIYEGTPMGGTPVTSVRHTNARIVDGSNAEIPLHVETQAARIVKTTLPFNQGTDPFADETFLRDIFLRYGSQTSDGQSTSWGSFQDSNVVKAANIALPVGHSIGDYLFAGSPSLYKLLTNAPRSREACKDGENHWLWFIGNTVEFEGNDGFYRIRYILNYENGTSTTLTKSVSGDGAYCIPCGTSNFPFDLTNVMSYQVQVWAAVDVGGVPTSVPITEAITFHLTRGCHCAVPYTEVYFLEPQGGYGTLPLFKVETANVGQSNGTFETPVDDTLDTEEKRLQNGLSAHSPRSFERVNIEIRLRYTPAMYQYAKGLRSTKERFIRYKANGTDEIWKFVPDEGSMDIFKHEDWVFAKMTGRVHLPLPVLENGI